MTRLTALACVFLACLPALAQRQPKLPERYSRWLNEEVVYIISDDERKAFQQLTTDEARDGFIKEFWEIRNPLRGSERNPFKEEHYRRIQYANETFGRSSGTPGWKTDMGRTYIVLGKPVSRAPFKGYGQIYPLELWFYSNSSGSPSLPPFFYVLFFMPEDIGEYRFYRPVVDGPMKLVRGSQFHGNRDVYNFLKPLGGDLAQAAFTLIPGEPLDTEGYNPSMTGDMLVSKIQEFRNDSFQLKRLREARYLRSRVTSWFLVADQQPLELSAVVLRDPAGQYWLDYALLVHEARLGRPDPTGKGLIVSAGFRLLNESGELIVEDAEERSYEAFEEAGGEKKFRPFVLSNRLAMVPGKYKLEVAVTNREAGRAYKAERAISVAPSGQVSMSGPLLASSIQAVARPDSGTPFQYFGVQFVPGVERRFKPGSKIRALLQIQAPPDQLRDYRLDYTIAHAQIRDIRKSVTDTIAPREFREGSLLKAKTLELEGLEPGDYRAVFSLHPGDSPQVVASAMLPFRIAAEAAEPTLYFLSNFRTAAATGVASYIRGLEALAQNRRDEASEYLRRSLEQTPSNPFAIGALVGLYFQGRRFDRVAELYRSIGAPVLEAGPEALAQVALSFWETGNQETARRVLEVAKSRFPANPLVAAAARKFEQRAN